MMRRNFAGHSAGDAGSVIAALAAADSLERVGGGKVRHVQPRVANLLCQHDVAVHDSSLGGGGHGTQPQAETCRTGVHRATFRKPRIFGGLHDWKIQLSTETQRHAHDVVIENGLSVGGYRYGSHALQGGETGRGGGGWGSGGGFFVGLSWLSQMYGQGDEGGGDNQSPSVELVVSAAANFAGQGDLGHAAIAQQNIHGRVDLRRRVDQVPAFDQQAGALSGLVLRTQHLEIHLNP